MEVVDEIAAIRGCDRLGSGVDAELDEDVLEVRRDGLRAENQVSCDFLGTEPCSQQRQHLRDTGWFVLLRSGQWSAELPMVQRL